ncbi:MAG TPA: penicillin-binding transpeptidase domain-containing protein [Bacillota bacterium]
MDDVRASRQTGRSTPSQSPPDDPRRPVHHRIGLWCLLLSLLLGGLALRLFSIQIVRGAELAARAVAQRTEELPLELSRGNIYDRHLRALHAPYRSWRLVAFTPYVEDPAALARYLADELAVSVDAEQLLAKLRGARGFVTLAEDLPEAIVERVAGRRVPGLAVVPYEERYGPGAVAPHIVGYINRADNRGVAGLEAAFDEELTGSRGQTLVAMVDARGRPLSDYRLRQPGSERAGNELVTTLDWSLQKAVQSILARARRPAAAVVVDAQSGDVLALASHPPFDQQRIADYLQGAPDDPLVNRAVKAYPPGSVFKAVVAAAALEAGVLDPDERVDCTGAIRVGRRSYPSRCPPEAAAGPIDWKLALAASSNEVFIRLGLELGADRLLHAARLYGFGRPTGLPLPEEAAGFLPESGSVRYDGDLANLAIGQGRLTVTPLQIAQFLTAVVNGGELQELRLVREVRRPDGVLVEAFPTPPRLRVFSTETAGVLRQALRLSVLEGTGRLADVPVYGAGGKTGTAETGLTVGGREQAHAWFAGFVPATLPQYVIVVFVENGLSGPEVAAPRFREIAKALLGS